MLQSSKALFLFESTYAVIKAERLCLAHQISCKIIPVPKSVSSECGMAIEVNAAQAELAHELLTNNSLNIHMLNDW